MAKTNCKLEGMELVSIETREEHEAIIAQIGKNLLMICIGINLSFLKGSGAGNFWTSGNDEMGPLFMWDSTGQTLGGYLNWAYGQPDDGFGINQQPQNCLVINTEENFLWYDYACSDEMRYICEKKSKGFI